MKEYYKRNRKLGVWLPTQLFEWFETYLDKYSVGANQTERFKFFLYKLQEMEEKGIIPFHAEQPKPQESRWAKVSDVQAICLRRTLPAQTDEWLKMEQWQRDRACEVCRIQYGQTHFRACQEVRKEFEEAKR